MHMICWASFIQLQKAPSHIDILIQSMQPNIDPEIQSIEINHISFDIGKIKSILFFIVHFAFDLLIILSMKVSTRLIQLGDFSRCDSLLIYEIYFFMNSIRSHWLRLFRLSKYDFSKRIK